MSVLHQAFECMFLKAHLTGRKNPALLSNRDPFNGVYHISFVLVVVIKKQTRCEN